MFNDMYFCYKVVYMLFKMKVLVVSYLIDLNRLNVEIIIKKICSYGSKVWYIL